MNSLSLAKKIRINALHLVHKTKASHIGSCFSIADLLAVFYLKILRIDSKNADSADRDRFIISKGHAAAVVYSVLAEFSFFPKRWLDTYCVDGSHLTGHVSHSVPGVEVSTGSLGHGLSIGCGLALAGKKSSPFFRVFVLLSDGELDEGSNWEAILFAPQHQLDNLTVIIDHNKLQGIGAVQQIIDLNPLADKFIACNWAVKEIDGHNHNEIIKTMQSLPFERNKPSAIIAHTVKGKGVSFMENKLEWHYRSPDEQELNRAIQEIEKE